MSGMLKWDLDCPICEGDRCVRVPYRRREIDEHAIECDNGCELSEEQRSLLAEIAWDEMCEASRWRP